MLRFFFLVLLIGCVTICSARAETFLVLPFFNASTDPNLEWVGDSISENLRDALAAQGLVALEREGRREAYHRLGLRSQSHLTRASVIKVGEFLDADQILYGDFELTPSPGAGRGSLRVTAHILDVRHLKQGPEFAEIGALEDLAALQTHLAWQTLQFLIPKTAPSEAEYRKARPPIRVDAMENYIRGLLAPIGDQKVKLFLQANRLDPSFSPPAYQLGRLYYEKKEYKPAAEWLRKVAPADLHYHEANFVLGLCRYYTADYAGAQAAFELVAQAVPLNEVFNNLGAAQQRRNMPAALENFRKALDGDSTDPAYQFNVGYALFFKGDVIAAAERFRAVLDRNPGDAEATMMLGRCLKKTASRITEPRGEGLERLKTNYEESAYWQLKAVLQGNKQD